ncbi:MAG: hypothetical protein IT462_17875 [Planctomycetes bacterium]|nr:hypothetical protein [Planctomycetota bacterium]
MYSVDSKDKVVELKDIPQSSVGAPCPIVVATEHTKLVGFFGQTHDPAWNGESIRIISPNSKDEPVVVVRFDLCASTMFGAPNDEAFSGHPLASRGLHPYGAFEVLNSSWIRQLEKMNSVHPHHSPKQYAALRHVILAFHDSTFECVTRGYTVEQTTGSLLVVMADRLRGLKS